MKQLYCAECSGKVEFGKFKEYRSLRYKPFPPVVIWWLWKNRHKELYYHQTPEVGIYHGRTNLPNVMGENF